MKNYEKYKTVEERLRAHYGMCALKSGCNCKGGKLCLLKWLEQEAEEKKPKPLPCPFCGGKANIKPSSSGFFVECNDCTARTYYYEKRSVAVEAWNRRAK